MLIFVFKYLLFDEGLGFRCGAVEALGLLARVLAF
jgi:hypothetical protein